MSMSNLEINKNTNLKLYEAVRTGSSASQTVPFPQQLVMKKIGLNTANIEIKEAKCLWS